MGRSGHWIRWSFAAASLLLLFSAAIIPVRRVQAQATSIATPGPSAPGTSLREILLQATLTQLPGPPATIGLDRITLAPAARIPSHTHPGPAFVTVESGTLTVRVGGQAVFAPAREPGTPAAATVPPVDRDFDLGPGDQIVFPPDVPLTFSNTSTGATRFLATLIVPAGNQHPPAWSWLDGAPGPEALAGVTLRSLGTGLSTTWPPGPLAVTLDRLALGPGQAIPGLNGPLLLALETGQLTVAQGASDASAAATPGAHYELNPGTALFFPRGTKAIPRTSETGLLVLLRLSVLPATGAAVPAATPPDEAGQTRTPRPTQQSAQTPAATNDRFPAGTTAVVNESGVRLRAAPSTTSEVVTELEKGRTLRVTGPPQQGDGILWYPIEAVDDPTVVGFIAVEFLAPPK